MISLPTMRWLVAIGWLAVALAPATAAASTSAVPYSIGDIGPAPSAGFKISDIGAAPAPGNRSGEPPDASAVGYTLIDLGPG